jgi:hypothetical protein
MFHVRDGKARKLIAYGDHDRALADLGLHEWVVSAGGAMTTSQSSPATDEMGEVSAYG